MTRKAAHCLWEALHPSQYTVDLNPMSRTAIASHITIVDNVLRAMPALIEAANSLKGSKTLRRIYEEFDNQGNLAASLKIIRGGV